MVVPNPSVLWPFWMCWLEGGLVAKVIWGCFAQDDSSLRLLRCLRERCTVTGHLSLGTCVRGALLALSLLGQPARFAGERAAVG